MESSKKTKNVLTKNRYIKLFPFVLIPVIVGLIYIFNYLFNTYTPYIMVENEGFMLGNNELSTILSKDDLTKYDNDIKVVEVHEADTIYKVALGRYVNEEKQVVDLNYPVFINEGLSIVNYNESINLIDNDLARSTGFSNQVFSYGRAYELNNYEQIDNVNYILLNYSNGIYVNLFDLKISTNANEYDIPVNSFIYFLNDKINYYERDNNTFVKKQIIDVDYDSKLSFYYNGMKQQFNYRYEDFLIGLGKLFKEDKIIIPPKEIIEEEDQEEVVDIPPVIIKPEKPVPTSDTNSNNNNTIPPSSNDKEDFVWIKPSVTSTRLEANVYSASGSITINDPAGVIVKAPSYTITYNGKTYSRRSFYTTGDFVIAGLRPESKFDIVGQYTYLDEDMKTKKIVTFFNQSITTKSMDSLDPIELSFDLGDIYARKIELKDLVITSDIKSETLRGVRSIAFTIDDENYYFTSQNVNKLINGKKIDRISTSESLSSNRDYDFEINIIDTIGNKIKVLNNKGKTRTSKKIPAVILKIVKNEIDHVILGIDLKNDDNVEVNNYRYVITNTSGKVMQQALIDSNKIRIENLDPNQIFTVKVLGDFDLNDDKGLRKDYELTYSEFTSLPITSLGFLNLSFTIENITSGDVNLKYRINAQKTDARLVKLVSNIKIDVYNLKTEKIVKTFNLSKSELESFKEMEELELYINGLDSNTKYHLNISSIVKQGETTYDLECLHNLEFFETHKKKPDIDLESSFVTNDMIDFDIRIVDIDGAILSSKVRIELRDNTNKLIASNRIGINAEFERITYKYLKTNATYYIVFIADEYNETNNNSTFKAHYELARIERYTEDGISGKIELNSALRVANGVNLADVESEIKWIQTTNTYTIPKTVDNEGNMHIYAKKGSAAYTYDLSEYHGEYVTVSFKIKAITKQAERIYFANYVSGSTSTSYAHQLDNISTNDWTSYSFSFIVGSYYSGKHFILNRSQYYGRYYTDFIGFYINNVSGEEQSEFVIKDFEIHKTKEKVAVNSTGFELEKGTYTSTGKKDNSGTYNDYRIRPTDAIILEGDQVYEILFSEDTNYTAYIYFTDMNNKYLSAYGWFESGRYVYVPANTKMYLMFRYYGSNLPLNPEDIDLHINKYNNIENPGYQPFTYDFITKIKINMNDLHDEVANNTYYVRVSDKEGNEIYVNEYLELVDTNRVIDAIKTIDLLENNEYRVSLFIKIRDREYELDYFNVSTNYETLGVSTVNDWSFIQPNGNYIILNDLDFKDYTLQVLGWGYRYFYGMIDFQGYSANIYSKTSFQRLGRIEKSGVIKNLVLNVHLDNEVNNNSIRGFISNNYGTIENVMVNIYDERPRYFDDVYLCTLADTNSVGGRIRNFVVNLRTRVNLYWDSGLIVRNNYGLIENGYTQGENAFVTNARSGASSRSVSLIQRYGGLKSTLQNAFVLSSIEFPGNFSYDITGLLSHETYGVIQNVYTTGSVNNINQAVGPIVGYVRATAEYNNAYYLSDYIYTTLNQNKIPVSAINDISFQKEVLKDGFNIEEMIELGYYPQVKYTYEKMPKQDYIELPKVEDKDIVDILSISVVSKTNNSAIVDLTIQNEFGDEITDIAIANLNTKIISQTFEDGKSFVQLEVTDPQVYVSKYEIRSITSKSYNNISSQRRYSPGDKYLYVDLYREINDINDWYTINSFLNQNFALMSDIDFREYTNYYINNYSGILKGNNHVLKNITILSNKSGLFNQMNGTMENLYFENVTKTSDSTYAGIIGYSNQYGKFNNVHAKNVIITVPSNRTTNSLYVGALVGNVYYSKFTNCSVTDVVINVSSMISDVQVGGFAGYSNGGTYSNVYAQNVDIDVRNTISTLGVGGLIGREVASVGTIRDAYTTGKIYTNGRYAGGMTGNTQGYIENTYSIVNIVSELKDIGGITGHAGYVENINNNLFIGNLASKLMETTINRIIGTVKPNETNYALSTLLINGVPSDKTNGEKLISPSELLKPSSYNNDNGLQLGDAFDYSKVSQGIIPKVYYMDTDELLPNQEDIYFYKDLFEISDIVIDKHAEFANIVFYLKNPNQYIIDDIVIEDMETNITQNTYNNGISIVSINATPKKYFDSYYTKEIKYHINGSTEELSCEKLMFLEMIFYKNLRTFDDWQNVSKSEAENYLLLNDIDFTGLNYNRDVIFNRLETVSEDEVYTLKGMRINQTTNKSDINIIKKVMASIKNIKFEDIDIEYLQTSSSDYVNIIDYIYGEISNVHFENITINAPTKNRVAMIGRSYTELIDNVTLKDINITGKGYVSGLLAYYENLDDSIIKNIEAENITITASANYVGGIFANFSRGSSDNIKNTYGVNIKDSTITAINGSYVGGIGASAEASDSIVDNVHVIGREYVGGAFGYEYAYKLYNVIVKNSIIEGSYRYIGGLSGQARAYVYDSIVEDVNVIGTAVDTIAVGGFHGYYGSTSSRNAVKNTTVNNNGNMTGGFIGLQSGGTISINSIDNVIVNGVDYVGGITGDLRSGTITNNKVTNCTINAQNKYAGGVIGYHDNSVTGSSFNEGSIRNSMILASNITSNSNAGGFVGAKNEKLYYPYNNYGLYLDSSVSTTDNETAYIGVGDSSNEEFVNLSRMGFYADVLVNNIPIKNSVSSVIQDNNMITEIVEGFINESTGVHEMNYNYPQASHTDYISLKAGKTYLLKAENASKSTSDVFRVRFYDTNNKYIGNAGGSGNTWNYLGNYYSFSNLREAYFTPVRDVVIIVQYMYEIKETSLVEVKSSYANMLQSRLFNATQLRNRILWNRYMSNDQQDFYYVTYFGYDQAVWDFSTLKNEITNKTILDKSNNSLNAKASFTAITDDGLLVGGIRDEVKIDNFEPESNITISTRFISYSGRSYQYLFSYRDPSVSSGVGLFLHGRTIYAMINGSTYSSGYVIPLYKEVFVTMTYDNNNVLKIYINGELVYSNLNVRKTIKTTENAKTYIANDATYNNTYKFLGIIKRVDVYNRALGETEINNDYYHSYGIVDSTGLMLSYDFTNLSYEDVGYYPMLKDVIEQASIPLPTKSANSLGASMNHHLSSPRLAIFNEQLEGNYHIYSSSIDTINIEFDKISNDLSFEYINGDVSQTFDVSRRVYTLKYDYNSDITIKIKNAFEEKVVNITKDDLRKTIAIYNNNYYYIKNNKLYNQNGLVLEDAIHIYKNLVLLSDNKIYNLETGNIQNTIQTDKLIVNTIPLYQSVINGKIISTYYNYTELNEDDNETIREGQIIYKDGYLYNVNVENKDNSSIIVNNYNGSEYQIVLGFDKELYSYKTSLNVNSSFINANIKEINADFDSKSPVLMVKYDNGEILVLNYYNGEALYDSGGKQNISLIDFMALSLSSNDLSVNNSSYNENNSLMETLENITDKEINDLLKNAGTNIPKVNQADPVSEGGIVNNNTVNNKYSVSYNENTKEYEIYDTEELLFSDSPVSINSKIKGNKVLYNYFQNNTKINEILKDNRVIIYIAIILLIVVNLVYLVLKARRKEVVNE